MKSVSHAPSCVLSVLAEEERGKTRAGWAEEAEPAETQEKSGRAFLVG